MCALNEVAAIPYHPLKLTQLLSDNWMTLWKTAFHPQCRYLAAEIDSLQSSRWLCWIQVPKSTERSYDKRSLYDKSLKLCVCSWRQTFNRMNTTHCPSSGIRWFFWLWQRKVTGVDTATVRLKFWLCECRYIGPEFSVRTPLLQAVWPLQVSLQLYLLMHLLWVFFQPPVCLWAFSVILL